MKTECSSQRLLFQEHGAQGGAVAFDGGAITSDAGGLLLREVDQRFGIFRAFAGAFTDHRDPELVEFSMLELLTQRVMGSRWAMRGSMIMSGCGMIRCWLCWPDAAMSREWIAAPRRTAACRWQGRARSTAWN